MNRVKDRELKLIDERPLPLATVPNLGLTKSDRELAEATDISITQIEEALKRHYGNITYTAEFLGMDRDVLERKMKRFPHIMRLQRRIKEEFVDLAEDQLRKKVEKGHFQAVALVLKTLGKDRGYTERTEMELGENAVQTAAALIEAMRKGTALPPTVDIEDYEWKPAESESEKVS